MDTLVAVGYLGRYLGTFQVTYYYLPPFQGKIEITQAAGGVGTLSIAVSIDC